MATAARAWFLIAPRAPLQERELVLPGPAAGEAVVEVWANGACHTDLSYADGAVRTVHPLPLVLGRTVVVPAVLPCGECALCRQGRGNACPQQKMPGNDIHGAFATHLLVPAAPLQPLEDTGDTDPRHYSVVADAVSTAWQATRRAGVQAGDLCAVVGAGGVGGFVVQICAALGAQVIALDVGPGRLELISRHGAAAAIDTRGKNARTVRDEVQRLGRGFGIDPSRTRIFECAGVPSAQELAFGLLARGAVMVQVGFSPEKVSLRLSNLMAFDATLHGSWGCPPDQYPHVLRLIADGKVQLAPFVEVRPMRQINAVLDDMRAHRLTRRVALDPRL